MTYNLYRHDTPHRTVTANSTVLGEDADGMVIAYDPLCAECNRVGFCTWDQGPCTIGGPTLSATPLRQAPEPDDIPRVTDAERADAFEALDRVVGEVLGEDAAFDGPVYSTTKPCPMCGEVHPV